MIFSTNDKSSLLNLGLKIISESEQIEEIMEAAPPGSARASPPRSAIIQSYGPQNLWSGIALNILGLSLYGYAILYQNFDRALAIWNQLFGPTLQSFGLWKFLTYHSLIFQLISCILHLVALSLPRYAMLRDISFTSFAFPLGTLVVFTFWGVWWTQGRDMIYPVVLEKYYPIWLNHVTHTIILPFNIAQSYLTCHRYLRKGSLLSCAYVAGYCIFTLYMRYISGIYVYPFMNEMSEISLIIFIISFLFCTVALYEIGFLMTGIFHLRKLRGLKE